MRIAPKSSVLRSRCTLWSCALSSPAPSAKLEEAGVPFKGEVSSDWLPTLLLVCRS